MDKTNQINDLAGQFIKMSLDDVISNNELSTFSKKVVDDHFGFEDMKKLLNTLFLKTEETLTDDADKKKVACLQKVVGHLVANFFDGKGGISDAIFFPGEEGERSLIKYLGMAKQTLDVCVFTISNDKLAKALESAHNRGVKVRLISDDECVKNKGSDVQDLADKGIPTRTDKSSSHMHNKYVVVDNRILITGSFNWTWQAVKYNQENLIIVEKAELVKKYHESFEKVWAQFEGNQL